VPAFGVERSWLDVSERRRVVGKGTFELPSELGYYDTASEDVRRVQGDLAFRYGVDAMLCPFPGRDGEPSLLETVLDSGLPTLTAGAWWTVELTSPNAESSRPGSARALADDLLRLFAHDRYLRLGGRPVVVVEHLERLSNAQEVFGRWRERALLEQLGDPIIICVSDVDELEIDVSGPGECPLVEIVRVGDSRPGVDETWEATREDAPAISSLVGYRRILNAASKRVGAGGILVVDGWNDWLNGFHLEPGRRMELGWLDAHAAGVRPSADDEGLAARDQLFANRLVKRELEAEAAAASARGEFDDALRISAAAADWSCHQTALWVSPELERIVNGIGRTLLEDFIPWRASGGARRRIAHVLSDARAIGGHTRLAWRWMTADTESEHSLVLTRQGDRSTPPEFEVATNGRVIRVTSSDLSAQVQELAAVLQRFDLVVLHILPYDAVAVAACADPTKRPRVVFVNHADHLFWLGIHAADAVVNIRPSAARVCSDRRGVNVERIVELPIPLGDPEDLLAKSAARESIGMPRDAQVMLTMASSYKYTSGSDPSLQELIGRVLSAEPAAQLVAIGPRADEPGWAGLRERFGDRVQLLGEVEDTYPLRSAADVYLDSYPFASITSLLEVGSIGVPAVCFQPHSDFAPMYFDDVDVHPLIATTASQWIEMVATLLRDETQRSDAGQRLRREINAVHRGDPWRSRLETLCGGIEPGAASAPQLVSEEATPLDDALYLLHSRAGITRDIETLVRHHGMVRSTDGVPSGDSATVGDRVLARIASTGIAAPSEGPVGLEQPASVPTVGPQDELLDRVIRVVRPRRAIELGAGTSPFGNALRAAGVELGAAVTDVAELLALGDADRRWRAGSVDLIVCVDVLRGVPRFQEIDFVDLLCSGSSWILLLESRYQVLPNACIRVDWPAKWMEWFAGRGYFRDPESMSVRGDWEVALLHRSEPSLLDLVQSYEQRLASIDSLARRKAAALLSERDAARHQQHLTWLEIQRLIGQGISNDGADEAGYEDHRGGLP
jgi:hypothetical protein